MFVHLLVFDVAFGYDLRIGFLLLLICVPGLCCWFCWIKVLKRGEGGSKARSLPEIVDMESVSGVSTRTEPTVSGAESSACQARQREAQQSQELFEARRRLEQLLGTGGAVKLVLAGWEVL
eukprot:Skav214366  [mRNA]  locus=scaffold86:667002:677714:+ [translate_table: standard]